MRGSHAWLPAYAELLEMESTCPTPPGSSTHLLLLQVAGGELHLLQLPRTQLEPAVGSAKVLVQLVVQIHPDAHQHCEATAGPLPWAPGVVNQPWRGKKKKCRSCEQIRLRGNHGARESDYNLQHDAHLKDKDLSVKSLVKEGFSNMLAKHAATNTVPSCKEPGLSG